MLNSLQGCRAVAALLVVLFHTSGSIFQLPKYFNSQPFGRLFDFGYGGVDLFFVLSGFIIWKVHAKDIGNPQSWSVYLSKRLWRIFPPYWVMLTLLVPVFFLVPSFGTGTERQLDRILTSYFLLPHPTESPILVVAWSLVFELFFYFMFSLLILNRWVGLLAFSCLVFLVSIKPSAAYPWHFLSHDYHSEFLLGILASILVDRVRLPRPHLVAFVGISIFFGYGLFEAYGSTPADPGPRLAFAMGSMLMLAGLVQLEQQQGFAMPRLLTFLGDASYSIYLVHLPTLSVFAKVAMASHLDRLVPHWFLFVAFALGALAVGCVFHVLVEKPILRRRSAVKPTPKPAEPLPLPSHANAA